MHKSGIIEVADSSLVKDRGPTLQISVGELLA